MEDNVKETGYLKLFDERERKQIEFCKLYEKDFHHGAVGHIDMLIIAKLSRTLAHVGWLLQLNQTSDSEKVQAIKEFLGKE